MNIAHAMAHPAAPADAGAPPAARSEDAGAFDRLLREQRGAQATDDTQAAPDTPEPRAAGADADGADGADGAAADIAARDSDAPAGAFAPTDADPAGAWMALAARAASDAQAIAAAPPSSPLADQVRSLTELSRAWSTRGLAIPAQAGQAGEGRERAQATDTAATDAASPARSTPWRSADRTRPDGLAPHAAPMARRSGDTAAEPDARAPAEPAIRQESTMPPAATPAPRAPAAGVVARAAQRTAGEPAQTPRPDTAGTDARAVAAAVDLQGGRLAATSAAAPDAATPQASATSLAGIAGLASPAPTPAPARAEIALPAFGPAVHMALPAPVGSAQFAPALGQQLVMLGSAGDGVRHAEMRLDPPELGPLRVSLSLQGDQASAVFLAAHPATRQAIEAALPQLQQQLAEAGIQLGQSSVGDQQAFEQHARQAQRGTGLGGDAGADAHAEPAPAPAAPRGLVDTFA